MAFIVKLLSIHGRFVGFETKAEKVKTADLNNISGHKNGGSCTAAGFLQEFVGTEAPWLHLDIAGVMKSENEDSATNYLSPGMSGRPTRTLIQLLQDQQS